MTKEDAIRSQRGEVYGDVLFGHIQLGKAWSAILSAHYQIDIDALPPNIVALMLAAMKLARAALPLKFDADTFVDARNYVTFAEECDDRNPMRNVGEWRHAYAVPHVIAKSERMPELLPHAKKE